MVVVGFGHRSDDFFSGVLELIKWKSMMQASSSSDRGFDGKSNLSKTNGGLLMEFWVRRNLEKKWKDPVVAVSREKEF